jgi:malate dehydrogenase
MPISRKKISIIGAGNVGGATAQRLVEKHLVQEVVLLDIIKDLAVGKALDLSETAPLCGFDTEIRGTDDYAETKGSDIVVITSGVPRKPGMSRDDLLSTNARIVKDVAEKVARHSPGAILIIVSNPLDAMTYVGYRVTKFPRERIMGMAGVLDSSRMASFIAKEMKVSVHSVQAIVLGGHGDAMVPLLGYTTVAGVPISQSLPQGSLDAIVERTRDGGAEIVKFLKTGSAYYAPSAAIVEMIASILQDWKKILPCAALCQGEYGIRDLFVGVPAKLGAAGMESIVEFPITPEEEKALKQSANQVQELCRLVDKLL